MQDVIAYHRPPMIKSSAHEVVCYVCGKGLEDGFSVTAKTLRNGTVWFCDVHHKIQ